jgi:hypothetical protein
MYWLYIYQGKVVHTLEMDGTPTADDWPGTELYDTVAQDDSKTFQVGDTFTADLQLYYNRNIWRDIGWIDANTVARIESNPPITSP